MNTYTRKLIRLNNKNQRPIIPEHLREDDWRYQVMELPSIDLRKELANWSREKMIYWLGWNDPNGIWTNDDLLAEGYEIFTKKSAEKFIYEILLGETKE